MQEEREWNFGHKDGCYIALTIFYNKKNKQMGACIFDTF